MIDLLLTRLRKIKTCRIIQLTYTSKGTGELAKYTLLIGVNYERVYRRDLKLLRSFRSDREKFLKVKDDLQVLNDIEYVALEELIASMEESLHLGIGNNTNYTNKDTYQSIFPGCKQHLETKAIYIQGYLIKKQTIQPGTYKEVKSKLLTLAKNSFRKRLKLGRFRTFDISLIESISLEKQILTLS